MPGIKIDEERLALLPKRSQDRALKALRELETARKQNPLQFYEPHPKGQIFHRLQSKYKVFIGGTQSGKTTSGATDCLIQAVDTEVLPQELREFKKWRPPFRCRIYAPSRQLVETVIFEKLQEWVPRSQLAGNSWKGAYDKMNHLLHFANGSQFAFFTYEQDLDKMGGATVHRVWMDEEPPVGHLTEAEFRVMRFGGDLLFTFTPVAGISHMYKRLQPAIEAAEQGPGYATIESDLGDMSVVLVSIDDNPHITEKEREIALANLSREERLARQHGKFVALHGLIYDSFNFSGDNAHVIGADSRIPDNVNVVVGIDPGIHGGCGVVWAYLTHDDQMVVFEEVFRKDVTIKVICDEIHKVNAHYGIKPIYYVIDPAARNRSSHTGRSDQMEFADHGVVTISGQNAVEAGINRVKERFQTDRIKIWDTCSELIDELRMYRWKDPPRTGEDPQAKPFKKDDHLVDALRYLVMSRPYLPEERKPDNETPEQRMMRLDIEALSKPPISPA